MQKSENIDQLATAACAALRHIGHPIKNKKNPHFKNTYADLLQVVECTREDLLKHGLWLVQVPDSLDGFETPVPGVTTMIVHESGQFISFTVAMPDKPQQFGSGFTYLRRYGQQGICDIVAEEDDDAEATTGRSTKKEIRETPEENW